MGARPLNRPIVGMALEQTPVPGRDAFARCWRETSTMAIEQGSVKWVGSTPIGAELLATLAASGTGTWCWDASSGRVRWDETLEALSGLPPGGFGETFEAWLETLHPEEVERILAQVNGAIEHRSSYHFEHRTIWPDGTVRWSAAGK